jgi:hypothetical protein
MGERRIVNELVPRGICRPRAGLVLRLGPDFHVHLETVLSCTKCRSRLLVHWSQFQLNVRRQHMCVIISIDIVSASPVSSVIKRLATRSPPCPRV